MKCVLAVKNPAIRDEGQQTDLKIKTSHIAPPWGAQ